MKKKTEQKKIDDAKPTLKQRLEYVWAHEPIANAFKKAVWHDTGTNIYKGRW